MPETDCTCPYTDPSTWLSAASCGYGSGYEPGSMQEWDPDCPQHPAAPETETDADGLTEAEREGLSNTVRDVIGRSYGFEAICRQVERIIAERVRVVEGEREHWKDHAEEAGRGFERVCLDYNRVAAARTAATARAESAEAAREAEKAAHERLREVAESIAYEHAATVDGEFGCCHDEDALRAGGRVAEFDGDEFEPIPDDCLGQKTLDRQLALLGGGEAR